MGLYTPKHIMVESQDSTYFDGSQSSTGGAEIKQLSGDFDARIYLESSNDSGDSWDVISQFDTSLLVGSWQTRDIQPIIVTNTRRLRVYNADLENGFVEAMGREI